MSIGEIDDSEEQPQPRPRARDGLTPSVAAQHFRLVDYQTAIRTPTRAARA